jgi:hypothetical protein
MQSRLVTAPFALTVALGGLLSILTAEDATAPDESARLASAIVDGDVTISGEEFRDALVSDRSDDFQFDAIAPRFRPTPDVEFKEQVEIAGWGLAESNQERTTDPLRSPTGKLPVPFDVEVPPFVDFTDLGIVVVLPSCENEGGPVVERLVL